MKFEAISKNKVNFKVINLFTNEVILDNNNTNKEFIIERNKPFYNKYKVIIESTLEVVKDDLKIIIGGKYFNYDLEIFDIDIDRRNLEYEIFISDIDKKYTSKDVIFQIKCNKKLKDVLGFDLSEDKKTLTKIYGQNIFESILIKDYYNNEKNINISINNIDKSFPEIIGAEEGKSYTSGLKLIYKDNIGIKAIKIENTSKNQIYSTSFDTENKVIDNEILVIDNNTINPNYLKQSGNYTIIVTDFAGNQTIKHITIK